MKNKVKAVLISDVHFNINTLHLASSALNSAIEVAESENVPLIIAGDLNDTKAMLRAECANAIIECLSKAKTEVIILIGNHDLINEKSKSHSLNFLRPFATIVEAPVNYKGLWFIPYQSDSEVLKSILAGIPKGSTIIMHQGVKGAFMGEYIVDTTSIDPSFLAPFRCISGHYHRAQTLICDDRKHASYGEPGVFNYIGTPYTVTYAEAHDGPKGLQLLLQDNRLEQLPLDIRKHVIIETDYQNVLNPIEGLRGIDLLWLKVHGPASELDKLDKKLIGETLIGHQNFKLDKIYSESEKQVSVEIEKLSDEEMLDKLITDSEETKVQKVYLKKLWREVLK